MVEARTFGKMISDNVQEPSGRSREISLRPNNHEREPKDCRHARDLDHGCAFVSSRLSISVLADDLPRDTSDESSDQVAGKKHALVEEGDSCRDPNGENLPPKYNEACGDAGDMEAGLVVVRSTPSPKKEAPGRRRSCSTLHKTKSISDKVEWWNGGLGLARQAIISHSLRFLPNSGATESAQTIPDGEPEYEAEIDCQEITYRESERASICDEIPEGHIDLPEEVALDSCGSYCEVSHSVGEALCSQEKNGDLHGNADDLDRNSDALASLAQPNNADETSNTPESVSTGYSKYTEHIANMKRTAWTETEHTPSLYLFRRRDDINQLLLASKDSNETLIEHEQNKMDRLVEICRMVSTRVQYVEQRYEIHRVNHNELVKGLHLICRLRSVLGEPNLRSIIKPVHYRKILESSWREHARLIATYIALAEYSIHAHSGIADFVPEGPEEERIKAFVVERLWDCRERILDLTKVRDLDNPSQDCNVWDCDSPYTCKDVLRKCTLRSRDETAVSTAAPGYLPPEWHADRKAGPSGLFIQYMPIEAGGRRFSCEFPDHEKPEFGPAEANEVEVGSEERILPSSKRKRELEKVL